jgi:hypothetical protein
MQQRILQAAALAVVCLFGTACRPLPAIDIARLNGEATAVATAPATPQATVAVQAPPVLPQPTLAAAGATAVPPAPDATAVPASPGSYCRQQVGDVRLGFSAELTSIELTAASASDELVLRFAAGADSALPAAAISCLQLGPDGRAGSYVLDVALPGWQRDALFGASPITSTLALSGGRYLTTIEFLADPTAAAGLTIRLALPAALPFRAAAGADGRELRLTVGPALTDVNDVVATAAGAGTAPSRPLVLLSAGDVWLVDAARPGAALNLTQSPEIETAAVLSPDAAGVLFCRAAAGYEPRVGGLPVPAALYQLTLDGGQLRELAAIGGDCASPAISADGTQAAFVVRESADEPALTAIYLLDLRGDDPPQRIGEPVDAWSRSAPQWLADGALLYRAAAEDGRQAVRIRYGDGRELDIGDSLLVSPALSSMYDGLGAATVSGDGQRIAVELLRSVDDGSDLLILAADGTPLDLFGAEGFWNAPLGWDSTGRLLLLQTLCATAGPQPYRVLRWSAAQTIEELAAGTAVSGFGPVTVTDDGLLLLRYPAAPVGLRGPLIAADQTLPAELWWYAFNGSAAQRLLVLPDDATAAAGP